MPWLTAIGFLAVLVVNALSAGLPLNGLTPAQISDHIPNLFVPAGLTFSIWGVIYLALAVYVVHVFRTRAADRRTAGLFLLSCAANVAWIFLWHYGQVLLSLGAMLVLLGSLIAIDRVQERIRRETPDRAVFWMAVVPFRIYLGWISVATLANVVAVLVTAGWDGFGLADQSWTILLVAVACLLALARLLLQRDIAFACVVLWAFVGILLRHFTTFEGVYPVLLGAVSLLSLVLMSGITTTTVGVLRGGRGGKAAS